MNTNKLTAMCGGLNFKNARFGGGTVWRYLVLGSIVTCTLVYWLYSAQPLVQKVDRIRPLDAVTRPPVSRLLQHPIEKLALKAYAEQGRLLSRQSHDLSTAANHYRERRGRHPPPGFDAWLSYAKQHDAVVVEDFFDRIYHDLNPYWTLDPSEVRRRSAPQAHEQVVSVRNHKTILKTTGGDPMRRMPQWHRLIKDLSRWLPDVDVPFNNMDESRLLVPWDEIDARMAEEAARRHLTPVSEVRTEWSGLPAVDAEVEGELFNPSWIGEEPYWDLVRQTCPQDSPSRNLEAIDKYHEAIEMPTSHPKGSFSGYVQNWTLSKDVCQYPHMRGLHGAFVEPVSISTTQSLVPLFGGSKLSRNNEILIPPAMYLTTEKLYAGSGDQGPKWSQKMDAVVWRGVASGGRNKPDTWTHFHRHRWVQMLNGTALDEYDSGALPINATTFKFPDQNSYDLTTPFNGTLGSWLSALADVAFTRLECVDLSPDPARNHLCDYTDPYFVVRDPIPMLDQYAFKYLPDVDGNSYSGRFRAFLRDSGSLVLKTTLFSEWHDARLMPWLHFVPVDSTYLDIYGILQFFLGVDGKGGHDSLAEWIAAEGQIWAKKVLRREDMALYVWRLLLEFARICDDQRDVLGFVDDLKVQ